MKNMEKEIGRNQPCWCGSGRKYKTCHADFDAKVNSIPGERMLCASKKYYQNTGADRKDQGELQDQYSHS